MGHGFLENDTMFSVKERPWHGLGTVVEKAPTIAEAITLAGLDWEVEMQPIKAVTENFDEYPVTTHKAVIKKTTKDILGVVGANYKPLQNKDAFSFFEPLVENGLVSLETAGSLFNGKRVWIMAKGNSKADVVANDTVESFILLSNAHDGTMSVKVGFTPIRVVCNNTLTAAENDKFSKLIKVKHTQNIKENLKLVRDIMDTVNMQFIATIEQYRELAKRDICESDLQKYVQQVFSVKKIEDIIKKYEEETEKSREKLTENIGEYFEKEPEHKKWNMYNAVNSYLNHERGRTLESRYNSTWFGENKQIDRRALELALRC